MNIAKERVESRLRRKRRIRKRIVGTPERPRLSVFRSTRHIYAQIIDDEQGVTLVSASSLSPEISGQHDSFSGRQDIARAVGRLIAEKSKAAGIVQVKFDRGGYIYHGRVKALSEGAREGGLDF